jgi:hypothetical protein
MLGDHSDAEISIEMIAEPDPAPTEIVTVKEEASARIVEVIKDSSSQTMTMTVEEGAEPEITIERAK